MRRSSTRTMHPIKSEVEVKTLWVRRLEGENDRDAQIRDDKIACPTRLRRKTDDDDDDNDNASVVGFQSLPKEKIVLVPIAA